MAQNPKQEQNCHKVVKLLMLGESNVGKTSLVSRYSDNKFATGNNLLTVGIDTRRITRIINNQVIRLQFWDTAGQQKYKTIPHQYFRGVQGIILVYDITDGQSFQRIEDWLNKIQQVNGFNNLILMLVGNKVDLSDVREVSQNQAEQFAKEKQMKFQQTSAKQDINVQTMVKQIIGCIIEKGLVSNNSAIDSKIKLHNNSNKNSQKNDSCCS